jgi:hypothetical protein
MRSPQTFQGVKTSRKNNTQICRKNANHDTPRLKQTENVDYDICSVFIKDSQENAERNAGRD